MRCRSCDCALTDRESVRRVASTLEFLDLCNSCYEPIKEDVPTVERLEQELIEESEQVVEN